jgi:putative transposase
MITVRKIKMFIDEDDKEIRYSKYKFIRDSQYNQYLALNKAVSYIGTAYLIDNKDKTTYKDAVKQLTNSNPIFDNIQFGKGIDTKSLVTTRVKKDFKADIKNGLARGERAIRNYKRTFPLLTRGRDLKFYYDGEDIKIKWVNKIVFKVILGHQFNKNDLELRNFLHGVINEEYKVSESSIEIENKALILNLTVEIPIKKQNEFIQNRVVGVDIGVKIPAYVSLNDVNYIRRAIGSFDDFMKVNIQLKKRRERLQRQLKSAKGGKGREKKLSSMKQYKELQSNYNRTYNHFLSSQIIKFALENKAGQINIELLSMQETVKGTLLQSWSYYQLQQMLEYKAEREGIKVCYVDPYHTSQTCSKCGHYEEGQREKQDEFVCKSCGFKINADYNASRNIAMSTKYISSKEESEYYKNQKNDFAVN